MKNRKGFTLIEMLAVVTIIGLLAGLIITRINRSIGDSKKTASLANANLLVGAFEDYYMQAKARGAFNGCSYDFGGNSNTCTGFSFTGAQPDEGLITLSSTGSVDGDLVFGDYSYVVDGGIVTTYVELTDPVFDFDYVSIGADKEQYFAVPASGYYKLEVWGAQGGNGHSTYGTGGYGGYSSGIVHLDVGTNLFINVGGQGVTPSAVNNVSLGGYNGGGSTYGWGNTYNGSGGGATHIALSTGTLDIFDDNNKIDDILIVAGGGGGGAADSYNSNAVGGSGGGFIGNNGAAPANNDGAYGLGGTQVSGGTYVVTSNRTAPSSGSFGAGGSGASTGGSGGGGGFYGGGGGSVWGGSGGGSGYIGYSNLINGVMHCYDCSETGVAGIKTISTTGSSTNSSCPNGYSNDAISNCAKSGDGHARVTYIGRTLD